MEGDILLAISTSGNSPNVTLAVKTAKTQGIYSVGLAGGDGGELATLADMALVVKAQSTPRVQESHILAGHIICQLVDYLLFQQGINEE
jgi:D-sedoheptulose 7-phosphate isomerase